MMAFRRPDTPGGSNHQRGAVLAVVMVVVTSALMLGIVGVQSALVDQRQAGNYRAALKAQMRAESAGAAALSAYSSLDWRDAPTFDPDRPLRWHDVTDHPDAVHRCPAHSCLYLPVMRQGSPWVLALGVVHRGDDAPGSLVAHSAPVFVQAPAGATLSRD